MKSYKVLLSKYLQDYLRSNEKLMKSVVKIMRYVVKTNMESVVDSMPIEIP